VRPERHAHLLDAFEMTVVAGGSSLGGLTAKQAPHRPGTTPALGLRAWAADGFLGRRPVSYLGGRSMWPFFLRNPRPADRSRPRRGSFRPRLETLEEPQP